MVLKLNDLLKLSEDEINNSKIEFNMEAGRGGETFIDRWLKFSEKEKMNGICSNCSYWSWYGNKRNFYENQIVFSFIRLYVDEWLLISVGKVISIPNKGRAKVKIIKKYKPYFGRLIINCVKGNTYSRFTFNLKNYLSKAIVKEILPSIYSGDVFEGYDKINIPYKKLSDIFCGKISPTYFIALSKITGVYCLTDKKNGKLYIGSATGKGGVTQRWGNYFDTKHGGNKKLISLYKKKKDKYFEKYFSYTLLEWFGLNYDSEKIKEREQYWKNCFDTINNGYNDN